MRIEALTKYGNKNLRAFIMNTFVNLCDPDDNYRDCASLCNSFTTKCTKEHKKHKVIHKIISYELQLPELLLKSLEICNFKRKACLS